MDPTAQDLLAAYPEDSITAGGRRISYRQAGSGRPVVLLHGIGSGSGSWVRLLPILEGRNRLVAWNAPGYGTSERLEPSHPEATDYAAALADFITALDIQRPVLVGHSLGALMAAAYTIRHVETISGLVLGSPAQGHGHLAPDERENRLASRLYAMAKYGPEGNADRRANKLLSEKADRISRDLVHWNMARLNPDGYAQAARMLSTGTLIDDVAQIETDILVVCGSEDAITPPDGASGVAEAAPKSAFRLMDGAGHACYVEQPHEFARLLGGYLEDRL